MSFELLGLPVELIEYALAYLHPLEIVQLRQICQSIRDIIDTSMELQVRIELASDGFLVGQRGTLSAYELMRQVKARREAFDTFTPQWSWSEKIPVGEGSRQFEVSDGIWGISEHKGDSHTFKTLHLTELASPEMSGGRWELRRDDLGMQATDFSYWLGMEALVLMESRENNTVRRMHFRKLHANEVHPLAALPYMDFREEDCEIWETCNTVSFEDRLAMIFYDFVDDKRRSAAVVLDWTLGKILFPYRRVVDLVFLTKDILLIAPEPRDEEPNLILEVWSLAAGGPLYRCRLPLPTTGFTTWFLARPASNQGGNPPTKHAKLFVPDPTVEVLGVLFKPVDGGPFASPTVALSIQKFLRRCEELASGRYVDETDSDSSKEDEDMEDQPDSDEARSSGTRGTDEEWFDAESSLNPTQLPLPPSEGGSFETNDTDSAEVMEHVVDAEEGGNFNPWRDSNLAPAPTTSGVGSSKQDRRLEEIPTFEYRQWGRSVTCWIPQYVSSEVGIRTTFGAKMLVVYFQRAENQPTVICTSLLDFNPYPIRRAYPVQETDRCDVYTPTFPMRSIIGEQVIKSELPFRIIVSKRECRHSSFFFDGNTIIGKAYLRYDFFSFLPRGINDPEESEPPPKF